MDLNELRVQVCDANRGLVEAGLIVLSFGNASGVDRDAGVFLIKPSGVPYATLRPEDLVAVALDDGRVVEGSLRPSSDTPAHLLLYRSFPDIGGIVHTHSRAATAWAQAGLPITPLGTTHADHFAGPVPVTRALTPAEIGGDYEGTTGAAIVEAFRDAGVAAQDVPAVLVRSHGPFTWGPDAGTALVNAIALEHVAAMALDTLRIRPDVPPPDPALLERHHRRKHGPGATYGQPGAPGTSQASARKDR
jgi:L-ribulose-5-phosphate 4-epimerase